MGNQKKKKKCLQEFAFTAFSLQGTFTMKISWFF